MQIKVINKSGFDLPKYQTKGAAGFDLQANIDEAITLGHGDVIPIPTGLYFELPHDFELQIRSRGGLATKGVFVVNAPGTVDEDYRGEVFVILGNMSQNPHIIIPGDRIAQGVIAIASQVSFKEVDLISQTERGEGRFGSTGK